MRIKPISLLIVFIFMTLSFPIFGQAEHGRSQVQKFESPRLERSKPYEKVKKESIRHRSLSESSKSKAVKPGGNVVANPCSFSSPRRKRK